jgi:hypothetical protein
MNSLPGVWVANMESVNTCTTSEGEEPVYPDPGPEVQYGNGMSSSDPSSPGTCNSQASGKSYAAPSVDSSAPASSSSAAEHSDAAPSSTESAPSTTAPAAYTTVASPNQISAGLDRNGNGAQMQSTHTVTIDCSSTVTSTLPATYFTGSAQATASGFSTVITTVASAATTTATAAPYPSSNSSSSAGPEPGYASESTLSTYTPCVPGTFICTSATSWYTCNSASAYDSPRQVADGMECLPFLSPATSSTSSQQQGDCPAGGYRDDRYVRSRPNGDCSTEGALQCTNGGQGFEVCDQGGWVGMGVVAAGTTCANGAIVVS